MLSAAHHHAFNDSLAAVVKGFIHLRPRFRMNESGVVKSVASTSVFVIEVPYSLPVARFLCNG
jgi:hypothetical protein